MGMYRRVLPLLLLAFASGSWADIWPDSYELEYAGKYESAAELFDPLLKQDPTNEFGRLRRAWLHYLAGNYSSSQGDYKKALQANPESLDAMIGMALPLLAQQRWKEATVYAQQALHVAPWNYYAHLRLLVAEEGQQDWKTLLDHARSLHRRYPSDATVLVYQARAQLWLGDRKAARDSYRQVLQRVPGNIEAQNYMNSK